MQTREIINNWKQSKGIFDDIFCLTFLQKKKIRKNKQTYDLVVFIDKNVKQAFYSYWLMTLINSHATYTYTQKKRNVA